MTETKSLVTKRKYDSFITPSPQLDLDVEMKDVETNQFRKKRPRIGPKQNLLSDLPQELYNQGFLQFLGKTDLNKYILTNRESKQYGDELLLEEKKKLQAEAKAIHQKINEIKWFRDDGIGIPKALDTFLNLVFTTNNPFFDKLDELSRVNLNKTLIKVRSRVFQSYIKTEKDWEIMFEIADENEIEPSAIIELLITSKETNDTIKQNLVQKHMWDPKVIDRLLFEHPLDHYWRVFLPWILKWDRKERKRYFDAIKNARLKEIQNEHEKERQNPSLYNSKSTIQELQDNALPPNFFREEPPSAMDMDEL
jgi:hypothetical protein